MGILSKLLGSGDVIKAGFSLIDDMHSSKEEMMEARTKAKTELLSAYAPFKVTQRIIAWAFTATFLLCFLICLGFTLSAFFVVGLDATEIVKAIVDLMGAFNIHWLMMTIATFYFGGGFAEGIINSRKK